MGALEFVMVAPVFVTLQEAGDGTPSVYRAGRSSLSFGDGSLAMLGTVNERLPTHHHCLRDRPALVVDNTCSTYR